MTVLGYVLVAATLSASPDGAPAPRKEPLVSWGSDYPPPSRYIAHAALGWSVALDGIAPVGVHALDVRYGVSDRDATIGFEVTASLGLPLPVERDDADVSLARHTVGGAVWFKIAEGPSSLCSTPEYRLGVGAGLAAWTLNHDTTFGFVTGPEFQVGWWDRDVAFALTVAADIFIGAPSVLDEEPFFLQPRVMFGFSTRTD